MFTFLKKTLLLAATVGIVAHSSLLQADKYKKSDNDNKYQVTITNLTNAIDFTPILVSSHRKGVSIVELGSAASAEVTAIAEGGNIAPLAEKLNGNAKVIDVQNSADLLAPGQSVTVEVSAKSHAKYISLISMMLPTNDGFIALNSVRAPGHGSVTYFSPGYDAGTETNDESCFNIPGPSCGGEGPSEFDTGEGHIHIHRGIHGIGNLSADVFDWNNPVAKITIRRMK